MARPRALSSSEMHKEPHSVSMKVLRLSRPSLAQQHPLPKSTPKINHKASLAYQSDSSDDQFILTHHLTFPPAFGTAYVGETFACSLCATNELDSSNALRSVSSIQIAAEMQTPTQTAGLDLLPSGSSSKEVNTKPSFSMQRIVQYHLKEEGNHVLAVNVSYTETEGQEGQATSGKLRSFRKLYQFLAQPCLSVRTKASELSPREIDDRTLGPYGKVKLIRFALEAQLENVGESAITLERAICEPNAPFQAFSLNEPLNAPLLRPRDIMQLAYLLEQEHGVKEGLETLQKDMKRDGRTNLGQLVIEWRNSMGDKGNLTTGTLVTRKR